MGMFRARRGRGWTGEGAGRIGGEDGKERWRW